MLKKDPQWQTPVRTNQQKMPKQHFTLKREGSWVRTGGFTESWSPSACPEASFHFTKEKHRLAASASQGRNTEDPQNKWLSTAARNVPPNLLPGPASCEQQLREAFLPHHHGSSSAWGRLWEPDIARAQRHWALISVSESGSRSPGSKANKEKIGGKASLLYLKVQHPGAGTHSSSKTHPQPPPRLTISGQEYLKGGFRCV